MPKWNRTGRQGTRPSVISSMSWYCAVVHVAITPPWVGVGTILGSFGLSRTGKRDTIESMDDPHLAVRISGRERPERITLADGESVQEELARFLNRQGPYAQMWIRLASGEYVRYDAIESIAPTPPPA